MGIIRAFLRLPWYFWFFLFSIYMYNEYRKWEEETMVPLRVEIEDGNGKLTGIDRDNKEAEAFEKQRDSKFQEMQSLAESLSKSLEKLPKSSDVPSVLNSLAEIADRVGIEFSRFEPGKAELKGFLMETSFKIELKGSFIQIMSFMDEIAHMKRIITTKSISFKDPVIKGDGTILKSEAMLVTYHFDESARISQAQEQNRVNAKAAAADDSNTPVVDPNAVMPPADESKKGTGP